MEFTRGVSPSSIGALLHDRTIRLAAGLAIVVAIPVAILFYFQFRSISALSQSSTVVLRQLSQETADAVTKVLVDTLRTARVDVLLKIGQRQTEPLDLAAIESTFEQGLVNDPFVDRFYVWSDVTNDYKGLVLAYDRTSYGFITNPPESALLVKRFHDLAPEQRAIAIFDDTVGGRRDLIDIVATYVATDQFTFILNYDWGSQENVTSTDGGTFKAKWDGIAGYVNYQIADQWRLSVRGEYFDDKNGYRTGVPQKWKEGTVDLVYLPVKAVEIRAEVRGDFSDQHAFVDNVATFLATGDSTKKNQTSFGLEGIFKF